MNKVATSRDMTLSEDAWDLCFKMKISERVRVFTSLDDLSLILAPIDLLKEE